MEHFQEKLGLTLLLTLIVGVFAWGSFPHEHMTALYVSLGALAFFLVALFFGPHFYSALRDHREDRVRRTTIQREHQARTRELQLREQELALQRQKLQDEKTLRTMELALQQSRAEVERMTALIEAQVKAGQLGIAQGQFQIEQQRFAIEQVDGPLMRLTSSEWLYQPSTGRVIGHARFDPPTEVPKGLVQPATYHPPTMEECLAQLRFNHLQICLGRDASTGELKLVPFLKGVHYKLIGSSGMGKSCGAGGKLYQLTQTNDPDHLLLALLDMEHMTSRLFEECRHVAELRHNGRYVPMIATDAEEVADRLMLLCKELDRRARYNILNAPFLLIYVEEFLSLRHAILDEPLKATMLQSFTRLAVQGRKYRMYLMACAQDDYASEDLRSAKNQFGVREAYCVMPTAARSAGFVQTELIKQNYEEAIPGKYVLEGVFGKPTVMLAPLFSVEQELAKRKLLPDTSTVMPSEMFRPRTNSPVQEGFTDRSTDVLNTAVQADEPSLNDSLNPDERASEADVQAVRYWHVEHGKNKEQTILKVWNAKKGGTRDYQIASKKYDAIIAQMESEE
jgi:hypothetical protein